MFECRDRWRWGKEPSTNLVNLQRKRHNYSKFQGILGNYDSFLIYIKLSTNLDQTRPSSSSHSKMAV